MEGRGENSLDKISHKTLISEKISEALASVLPIFLLITALCLTVSPVPTDLMLSYLIASVLIVIGMGLFSLGADVAMTPIGTRIGAAITKSRNLPLILIISFVVGITISFTEPDLQVLAGSAPHINKFVLVFTVSVGVGAFLAIAMFRVLTGIKIKWVFIVFYLLIFALAAFADADFLGISFDSGGVTTGPMTVPFILAIGVGVSNIRSDKAAEEDSFGFVGLCSVGPILAVLILGFIYKGTGAHAANEVLGQWSNTAELSMAYLRAFPRQLIEVSGALAPITVIFIIFQLFYLKLPFRGFVKIFLGLIYTYVGLVLFLVGVNVGFTSLGKAIGTLFTQGWIRNLLVPVSMLMGWNIISAEPAVVVLEKQIEEVSSGAIPGRAIRISLSIAVSLAMGFSVIRVISGISILWFLVPGYAIALLLTFFVPDIFTAIAFDSGGVASGPMTATLMLHFVMGVSAGFGGNIIRDAFGVVALVAMMPLITIQALGVIYNKQKISSETVPESDFGDTEVIELWG
ncbi:MAG: DUF1538 domain-containing protein [Ruminococcaceae bacterium]|nr:DUF1538 domain-containing protein [Oscillospiraceae bacterium]